MTGAIENPPQNANKPFTPIYCETLRRAVADLNEHELDAWLYIASCADYRGICFPGIAAIADAISQRVENIDGILTALNCKGYLIVLRRGERDAFTRRMQPNVYQVPPDMLYIRDEHRFEAVTLANNALTDTHLNMYDSVFSLQNGIITRIINHIQNHNHVDQNQEPPPPTTTDTSNEAGAGGYAAPGFPAGDNQPDTAEKQDATKPDQREAQESPPGSAPPPPPRRADPPAGYKSELPDSDLERMAWQFKRRYGPTHIARARELYWQHGDKVPSAIAQYHKATSTGYEVKNPTGFIISKIEKMCTGDFEYIGEPGQSESPFSISPEDQPYVNY